MHYINDFELRITIRKLDKDMDNNSSQNVRTDFGKVGKVAMHPTTDTILKKVSTFGPPSITGGPKMSVLH